MDFPIATVPTCNNHAEKQDTGPTGFIRKYSAQSYVCIDVEFCKFIILKGLQITDNTP